MHQLVTVQAEEHLFSQLLNLSHEDSLWQIAILHGSRMNPADRDMLRLREVPMLVAERLRGGEIATYLCSDGDLFLLYAGLMSEKMPIMETMLREFSEVRTGRAQPALIEDMHINYYETSTPIKQLAAVSSPDPRQILIQPWDANAIKDIEAAADMVVWCVDKGHGFTPERPQDRTFVGNIVEAIAAYGEGRLGEVAIPLGDVNRIIAIGSDKMMSALARARHERLAPLLHPQHVGIGSINSPMQCMMKEICAQCLQRHRDPVTGKEMVVFTCFNQDQDLDHVDFASLADRLAQNAVSEKLTKAWIARCLD